MTVLEQKEVALNVLATIASWKHSGECYIAGGAPRDWKLGREARDIDIYCTGTLTRGQVEANIFHSFGVFPTRLGKSERAGELLPTLTYVNPYIKDVYEWEYNGLVFNLITLIEGGIKEIVDTFTFALCQVWIGADRVERFTEEAYIDFRDNTLTLRRLPFLGERGLQYVEKIRTKYPERRLEVGTLVEYMWGVMGDLSKHENDILLELPCPPKIAG